MRGDERVEEELFSDGSLNGGVPQEHPLRRKRLTLTGLITLILVAGTCVQCSAQADGVEQPKYLDTSLPLEGRVNDLVSRMTLAEKVSQMQDHAVAIPRLGIPEYNWWNEGLHGAAFSGYATTFPQVIGMAATWDTDLVGQMADTISTEARAKYNQAQREKNYGRMFGLTFWAPNINIFRDPRWGRGQETYGEDPFLTAQMAIHFVDGMQGDDSRYLKLVSTPKHFAVHSGPEPTRHKVNVDVSPHDLEDTYLPAFRAAVVQAHADSVMCAYNAIDGSPACANTMLLGEHLRDAWKMGGYVVSDCDAVGDIWRGHKFSPDAAHASAAAVKAGTDLDCGDAYKALVDAVQQGLITESEIDVAVKRLFTARFRLGMFDPQSSVPYSSLPFSEVNSPAHRKLALQAARESIVLLKNENDFLPLKPGLKIAVIGPNAEMVQSLQGNYNATPPDPVNPLVGIQRQFKSADITYAQGATLVEGLPVPVERTALQPASGNGQGLTGEYFNNTSFSGSPALTRIDSTINFNWANAIPVPGFARHNYSVRWTGHFVPPAAGDYALGVHVNSCYACDNHELYRLYLDGKLIADEKARTLTTIHFTDVKPHDLRLEYVHQTGQAGLDFEWQAPADVLRNEAVQAAQGADVIVAFVGLSPNLEGEEMSVHLPGFSGGDRTDIALPAVQQQLLESIAATGKPLVVVNMSGSAVALNWAQQHANAVLQAWYPGEEGGTAIAETLAGENNPSARLPLTFYTGIDQLPQFEDYSMKGRTYRYFAGKPLYPFGYGLSYSKFAYSNLKLSSSSLKAGASLDVDVDVRNESAREGDEVAELYLRFPSSPEAPVRALRGLKRVHVAAGDTQHVHFVLDARDLSEVNAQGVRLVSPGEYRISVGGGQPGTGASVVESTLVIAGEQALPK